MKFNSTYLFIALIALIIGGLVYARAQSEPKLAATTKYDSFAQCLTDAGAKFYGAFWCPHCNEQKVLFEKSTKIPYVECSTPDKSAQTEICIDKQVTSYPTWIMADGEVLKGVQQLATLAEKTNCQLPQ